MNLAVINSDIETGKRIRTRKNVEGLNAIIQLQVVRDRIDDLVMMHIACMDASDRYGDAIKTVSGLAGLQASVLRKFVAARAGDKFDDAKRVAEQLSLCFEEIGQE